MAAARRRLRAVHPVDPRHDGRRPAACGSTTSWACSGCGGCRRTARAADGAYVRYPAEDLLDIVALESHRAQALVVGEDLGTVEDGVREAMAEHGVLSYRLLWFEDDDPAEWPAEAMAAITTHDLPTVAGLWTGADLEEQREHGTGTDEELERGRTSLLEHLPGLPDGAPVEQAVERAHELLARGAVAAAVGHAGRRASARSGGRTCPAPPTGPTGRCRCPCRSRTCPATRCCRRSPARWPPGRAAAELRPRNATGADTRGVPAPVAAFGRASGQDSAPVLLRSEPRAAALVRRSAGPDRRSSRSSPLSPFEGVVAEATDDDVVAVRAGHRVVPGAAADDVLARCRR